MFFNFFNFDVRWLKLSIANIFCYVLFCVIGYSLETYIKSAPVYSIIGFVLLGLDYVLSMKYLISMYNSTFNPIKYIY